MASAFSNSLMASKGVNNHPPKILETNDRVSAKSGKSGKSGKSQGIRFTPWKVREKSGNFVKSQGKVREF